MHISKQYKPIFLIDYFFSSLFLIGLYTGVFYYISDKLYIPFYLCGISSIYFAIKNLSKIKIYHLTPIIYLSVVTFVGILFSDNMTIFFIERIKGFVQLIYSIGISYLFFLNVKDWPPRKVCTLFLFCIYFILVGTTLEILTDFKRVSDAFRETVFRDFLYDSDFRDLAFYGIIRPKLFTEEPSHVAKFLTLCVFVWFSLSTSRFRYILLISFSISGLFLIRSPLIFIIIPLSLLTEILFRKRFFRILESEKYQKLQRKM